MTNSGYDLIRRGGSIQDELNNGPIVQKIADYIKKFQMVERTYRPADAEFLDVWHEFRNLYMRLRRSIFEPVPPTLTHLFTAGDMVLERYPIGTPAF